MIAAETPQDWARLDIDRIDRELVILISHRVRLARRIGEEKRAASAMVIDPAREAAVVRRAGELARAAGIDDEGVRQIFWQLIALSREVQRAP
jgi:chorismate mutase